MVSYCPIINNECKGKECMLWCAALTECDDYPCAITVAAIALKDLSEEDWKK
jgi:hypothetical protein